MVFAADGASPINVVFKHWRAHGERLHENIEDLQGTNGVRRHLLKQRRAVSWGRRG